MIIIQVTNKVFIVLFGGKLSTKSKLIFIYFSSHSSEFLVIDLIKSLILHNNLHTFRFFLCSHY